MDLNIRLAGKEDSKVLTEISFASKHHWDYPEEYYKIWKNELTITEEYIEKNKVFLAILFEKIIGYYSIVAVENDFWVGKVFVKKGHWLEHIFVRPEHIGCGVGSKLLFHAKQFCANQNISILNLFVDPNAKGFYDKIGADYIDESFSSIEGRTVSIYELNTTKE